MKKKPIDITKFGPNYVPLYRRQQLAMKNKPETNKKLAILSAAAYKKTYPEMATKANVIDGKLGMGKWKWITGTSGLPPDDGVKKPVKKGFFGQFYERDELPPRPKGYVLIQKKHLDEAKWAIQYAIDSYIEFRGHLGLPKGNTLETRLMQALKNISVK